MMLVFRIWIDSWGALCLPLISMYICDTAPESVVSLYSLYMLIVSVLDRYLNTIPKFLIEAELFSKTYFKSVIYIMLQLYRIGTYLVD